jgi:hypothetical protein
MKVGWNGKLIGVELEQSKGGVRRSRNPQIVCDILVIMPHDVRRGKSI